MCVSTGESIATVDEDAEFVVDPDNDITEVKWVPIDEMGKYLDWGETVGMIQEELSK